MSDEFTCFVRMVLKPTVVFEDGNPTEQAALDTLREMDDEMKAELVDAAIERQGPDSATLVDIEMQSDVLDELCGDFDD